MKKIPSLFARDFSGNATLVTREPVEAARWVLDGEGIATRKHDGTCVMFDDDGVLWKRYDAKRGKQPPEGFVPAQDPDPITGHWTGWIRVAEVPGDWMHLAALASNGVQPPGTYELVGPPLNGNPDGYDRLTFVRHASEVLPDVPRDFDGLAEYLRPLSIEGIVWHHPDGRMVKIKRSDFHGEPNKRGAA